ncbi:hypothetical protein L1887_05096 [Cichorium endivia]|nr:hypothetical protein L1887_05096 [Cichorium endivia]
MFPLPTEKLRSNVSSLVTPPEEGDGSILIIRVYAATSTELDPEEFGLTASTRRFILPPPTLRSVVKSGIMEPKSTEEDCDFKGLPPKDKDVEKRLMGFFLSEPSLELYKSSKRMVWKFTTPVHGNTSSTTKNPLWGQIPANKTIVSAGAGLSDADIEQRLPGVAVDALSKSSEEFVVVSGQNPMNSLGLLCFKEEDSQTLLGQMKAMDPIMRPGSKVVPVVLSMVFQFKVNGVPFRFIPEASHIKNAIDVSNFRNRQQATHNAGVSDDSFSGVPVFQAFHS